MSPEPPSAGWQPSTTVRLVATDLDGTLLRRDKTISSRTRGALARLQAAGVVVVLVSGRPPRTLRIMAREAGMTGLAICCNGALIYAIERDEIVRHAPLAVEIAHQLIGALREAVPGVCFAVEAGTQFGCEPAFAALSPRGANQSGLLHDALTLCAEPVSKLIVRHADLSCEQLWEIATSVAGDTVSVTYSGAPFIEVSAAGVHKAWALDSLCTDLGILPSEVMAFGDMPNDLAMLRWAGRSVAVANAHPEVLAHANEITLSNDEDGVAIVLERLLDQLQGTPPEGQPSQTVQGKAVIFDLFGTLIDNFAAEEYQRVVTAIAGMLATAPEQFAHLYSVATWSMRKTGVFQTTEAHLEYVCRELNLAVEPALIAAASQLRIDLTRRRILKPLPGVIETLTELKARGYKIGLISDCAAEVPLLWPETELAAFIDVPVFSCSAGLAKPDPRLYALACERLGVDPRDSLYLGDGSGRELSGAVQAGMRAVLLRVPFEATTDTDRPEVAGWQGAHISDIRDVLTLVD